MFGLHMSDTSSVQPWEYVPAAAGEYKAGQLLKMDSGMAAAITAALATTPPYLCMADIKVAAGDELPVVRVSRNYIYDTVLSADAATAAVGGMLQVAAGGLKAAPGAGTFEIVQVGGTKAGDAVRGRFV